MTAPYRKTITVAVVYLAASVVATVVAVQRDLPAHVFNMTSDKPVSQDLVSRGTALSAPIQMLALLAVLIVLAALRWRGRSIAVVVFGCQELISHRKRAPDSPSADPHEGARQTRA